MKNEDFEFLLFDRIAKIQVVNEQYDLEHNAYIAFSGGKDSTILHYLIDLALPNNKIPRVFNNTGIEFIELVKYVKDLASKDNRIIINNANVTDFNLISSTAQLIMQMLILKICLINMVILLKVNNTHII